jgi:hypothetical protein
MINSIYPMPYAISKDTALLIAADRHLPLNLTDAKTSIKFYKK